MRRRAWIVLPLLALAGGCGTGSAKTAGACADAIIFSGQRYVSVVSVAGVRERPLGRGADPECRDDGEDASPRAPVAVFKARGVAPGVAIMSTTSDVLYLADGTLGQVAAHPLHRRLPVQQEDGKRACSERRRFPAVVAAPPVSFGELLIRRLSDGGKQSVALSPSTRVRGFQRAGAPFLQEGDVLLVSAFACDGSLQATELTPYR